MSVELIFDKVTAVEIGYDAGNHVTITNVLAFAERVVSVEGDMVSPFAVVNDANPSGVHHSHKYLEMLMVLDTDWLSDVTEPGSRWAYGTIGGAVPGQRVNAPPAVAGYAIDEDGENTAIEWFRVLIREHDGTETIRVYVSEDENMLWCVGETSEFSNEDGVPHQIVTFRFICLKDID